MNPDRDDPIERAIDEVLASMARAEPRRVGAASVRQAMGRGRAPRLPMGLAAAALLIAALGVFFRAHRAPVGEVSVSVARSTKEPSPSDAWPVPAPRPMPGAHSTRTAGGTSPRRVRTTTEPWYEGLPRLTIASIDLPEPLSTAEMDAPPLRIPRLEIATLSIAGLSTEPENK